MNHMSIILVVAAAHNDYKKSEINTNTMRNAIPRDLYTITEENEGNNAAADNIDMNKGQKSNERTASSTYNNDTKQQQLNNDDDSWRYHSVITMLSSYEHSFMI
jgi:hypothetical protein